MVEAKQDRTDKKSVLRWAKKQEICVAALSD